LEFSPNFPRLTSFYVSPNPSTGWGNTSTHARLALASVVVFTKWNGAEGFAGRTMKAAIDNIKSLVPVSLGADPIHAVYVVSNETFPPGEPTTQSVRDKLDAEGWWLYENGVTRTNIVPSAYPGNLEINRLAPADSNGQTWNVWKNFLDKTQHIDGDGQNAANPSLDALFEDNVFPYPNVNGDWIIDGTIDSKENSSLRLQYRTSNRNKVDYLKSIWPTARAYIGNLSEWSFTMGANIYNENFTSNYSELNPLTSSYDGGIGDEFLFGDPTIQYPDVGGLSKEYQERNNGLVGWYATRNIMNFMQGAVAKPATLFYSSYEITTDGSSANNQRLRFGAAAVTVCSDGCFDDRNLLTWPTLPAIYTGGTGGAGVGWLGQAIQTHRTQPYQNGVYVREFDNGYVAVNPRNNGSQTFTLPVNVRNVSNDVTYNAGSNIPLADRDGGFYRKI